MSATDVWHVSLEWPLCVVLSNWEVWLSTINLMVKRCSWASRPALIDSLAVHLSNDLWLRQYQGTTHYVAVRRRASWVAWPPPPGYWSAAAPKAKPIYSSAAPLHLRSLARSGYLHYAVYFTTYIANVLRMDWVQSRKCLETEPKRLHCQLSVPGTALTLLLHMIITASAMAVHGCHSVIDT